MRMITTMEASEHPMVKSNRSQHSFSFFPLKLQCLWKSRVWEHSFSRCLHGHELMPRCLRTNRHAKHGMCCWCSCLHVEEQTTSRLLEEHPPVHSSCWLQIHLNKNMRKEKRSRGSRNMFSYSILSIDIYMRIKSIDAYSPRPPSRLCNVLLGSETKVGGTSNYRKLRFDGEKNINYPLNHFLEYQNDSFFEHRYPQNRNKRESSFAPASFALANLECPHASTLKKCLPALVCSLSLSRAVYYSRICFWTNNASYSLELHCLSVTPLNEHGLGISYSDIHSFIMFYMWFRKLWNLLKLTVRQPIWGCADYDGGSHGNACLGWSAWHSVTHSV